MMVIFTSLSEKKALRSTRMVLDAYAQRIGNDTWKTIITEKGLETVKILLKETATKSTAVSCHWIRSRNNSELVWIVGNRDKFNTEGVIPVNSTKKNLQHEEWENNWYYLPQIRELTALAALLHDLGKANDAMQFKLRNSKKTADPLRHEWVSCKLIQALVMSSKNYKNDDAWLKLLIEQNFDQEKLINLMKTAEEKFLMKISEKKFVPMPLVTQLIIWLIISHHKLPVLFDSDKNSCKEKDKESFDEIFNSITSKWGYKNDGKEEACYRFTNGLLDKSSPVQKKIIKWAKRILEDKESISTLFPKDFFHGAGRLVLLYSHLCLMLSDHYISSQDGILKNEDVNETTLCANTNKEGKLKQTLEEHLEKVCDQALKIAQRLPSFADHMERAYDVKALQKNSPKKFAWQDNVVGKIKKYRREYKETAGQIGYFVINMASTGCGKTIANAKIMRAISEDGKSLRYILATGLRTLTLQTGDEYRKKIGLAEDELAVLIGSSAVRELHNAANNKNEDKNFSIDEELGRPEELLKEDLEYWADPADDFLNIFFEKKSAKKNKAFLYKPVLVATIDYMMKATETIKGGRYMLPFLRLMSSDLFIDEIDDFDKGDLIAIARLVHLAGMLGRSVVLSSATIPPDLAEGFFSAYQAGYKCHNKFFRQEEQRIICIWCDEFKAHVQSVGANENILNYSKIHGDFVRKRAEKLRKQIIKRKAFIVDCSCCKAIEDKEKREEKYFDLMRKTAEKLHKEHAFIDEKSGKKISFGVMRMANINPCVKLGKFLMNTKWEDNFAAKIMIYHSRQILLLRSMQERHLDEVLKRNTGQNILDNPVIRNHIEHTKAENILFIVAATPVEEIGRDHDFDWEIIEPSSYRSFIQMAGRLLRHREFTEDIKVPNIAIMQYNLKTLLENKAVAFSMPGFESSLHKLNSHDLKEIVDEKQMAERLDAVPRIIKPELSATDLSNVNMLIELEHVVMHDFKDLSKKGPAVLHGWQEEYWWLTGLPQKFNQFRSSVPQIQFYACWENEEINFCIKDEKMGYVDQSSMYSISLDTAELNNENLWLQRDYEESLKSVLDARGKEINEETMRETSERYGEISIPKPAENQKASEYVYSDQFGLLKKA